MNIPLNGRIAIVDDKIEEALPLMKVFSKNQIPYVFYKGDDLSFLPEDNERYNDIRLLFLDINFLGDAKASDKIVKSTLFSVLRKIISQDNYPYALIYWSKQEREYSKIIDDLFENELRDRAPISINNFKKSSIFNLDGEIIPNELDLLKEIDGILSKDLAYSCLLDWENAVHFSADTTLQELFSSYHNFNNWDENAEYLLYKLGESYSGKGFYDQSAKDKVKSSFNALNSILSDTLENEINFGKLEIEQELTTDGKISNNDALYSINKKLLISEDCEDICFSGVVVEDNRNASKLIYEKEILNNLLDIRTLEELVKSENNGLEGGPLKKKCSEKRKEIRVTWKTIKVIVTPLCDFVQRKVAFHRIVMGAMIESDYLPLIDSKSEALFISPKFNFKDVNYVLILNFRYFYTERTLVPDVDFQPIFRIRQQLLAEIQSKLSRHVNRQGVLFLDDR